MMIVNSFQAVLMVLVIIAIGFFVAKVGWAGETVRQFIPKLIINVTIPCTVISSFLTRLTRDQLAETWLYILVPFLAMGLAYVVSFAFARLGRVPATQRGVFSGMFALSNSGYMGLPVAMAIFGEQGMLLALFYFAANSAFMNSIGYIGIARDGARIAGDTQRGGTLRALRQALTPPFLSVVVALVLVACGVTLDMLPDFLSNTISMVGNITSPLALIFVGIVLCHTGLSCIRRIDRTILLVLLGRFAVSPLLMFLLGRAFGFTDYATGVLVVQTGLPAMVATTIYAEGCGADTDLAARGVVITTLLSFVTIPLYILLLGL